MNRLIILAALALAGCTKVPEPLTWERAQVLAKRCESKGLKPVYQILNPLALTADKSGGAVRWVACSDPASGAMFVQDQE